jgi:hypothetical protein
MRIILALIIVVLLAGIADASGTIHYAITEESPKGSGAFMATGQIFDTGTSDPVAALAAIEAQLATLTQQNGCCYAATQQ